MKIVEFAENKIEYETPIVEVIEVEVEKGFAESNEEYVDKPW